jgi:hypothetical protein
LGTAPVFLFPYSSLAHQVLLAFVLGGMVAGGVAHELNNILSGIVGYPDLLLM